MFDSTKIDDSESPVRKMVANSRGEPYVAIRDLAIAKRTEGAYLVMDGDDGGQVYLVAPLNIVACNEDVLRALLRYFDGRVWKDISMASMRYEIHNEGDVIWGGMGGGRAEGGLWIHEEFFDSKEGIGKILKGFSLPDILE